MITRGWRGWTDDALADTYEDWLLTELFPEFGTVPGFLSVDLLRRSHGQEVEFVVLTRFRDLDHIRAFAGEDVEAAVIPARGAELLSRYDTRAAHYETITVHVSPSPNHGAT